MSPNVTRAGDGGRPERPTLQGALLFQAGIAIAWIVVWNLSWVLEAAPHASLWFPAAGLTYAVYRILGVRGTPAILVGALAVTVESAWFYDHPIRWLPTLISGLLFFTVHVAAYGTAAFLVVRVSGQEAARPTPRSAAAFLIISPIAALAAAVGGFAALVVTGRLSLASAASTVFPWWLGDLAGLIAWGPAFGLTLDRMLEWLQTHGGGIAPSGLLAGFRSVSPVQPGWRSFAFKLSLNAAIIIGASLLVELTPQPVTSSFAIFFAAIPMVWIAYTEGAVRTCAAVAGLTTLIALATRILGVGDHTLSFQFAMVILAGTAYFGLAVPMLETDNLRLREQLLYDDLTGAVTRSAFRDLADHEARRSIRSGAPLSLIVFDVDRFKDVNDHYGHAFGDHVLTTIVDRCRRQLRAGDIVGRIGGEEFAILLPTAPLLAAKDTAERLRQQLDGEPIRRGSDAVVVTASFGVTEVASIHESLWEALERADRALYDAKHQGRNRVCGASFQEPA